MLLNVPQSFADRDGPQAVLRGVVRVSTHLSCLQLKRAVVLRKVEHLPIPDIDIAVLDQNFIAAIIYNIQNGLFDQTCSGDRIISPPVLPEVTFLSMEAELSKLPSLLAIVTLWPVEAGYSCLLLLGVNMRPRTMRAVIVTTWRQSERMLQIVIQLVRGSFLWLIFRDTVTEIQGDTSGY